MSLEPYRYYQPDQGREPFFILNKVPFPNVPEPRQNAQYLKSGLAKYWNLAQEDLKKITKSSSGHGEVIRMTFDYFPNSERLALSQVGEFVGDKSEDDDALRQIRDILQAGRLVTNPDIELWEFSKNELARYMIGIIAYNIFAFQGQQDRLQAEAGG